MTRQVNNSRKCIECGAPVPRKVKRCPACNAAFLKRRPTYERTAEHKQRMSQATTGKPKDYPTGGSLPGVAEKIQASWTPEKREQARIRGEHFAADPEWRVKIALSVAGPNNTRWEDGRAVLPYSPGFSNKTRELVWQRDQGRCQTCGSDRYLCVHHRDFQKDNHDLDNLVLLCRSCHTIAHVEHQKDEACHTKG